MLRKFEIDLSTEEGIDAFASALAGVVRPRPAGPVTTQDAVAHLRTAAEALDRARAVYDAFRQRPDLPEEEGNNTAQDSHWLESIAGTITDFADGIEGR